MPPTYIKEREIQQKYLDGEDIGGTEFEEWHRADPSSLQRAVDNGSEGQRAKFHPCSSMSEEQPAGLRAQDDPHYDASTRGCRPAVSAFRYPERGIADGAASHRSL